jgi:hypothetical protein
VHAMMCIVSVGTMSMWCVLYLWVPLYGEISVGTNISICGYQSIHEGMMGEVHVFAYAAFAKRQSIKLPTVWDSDMRLDCRLLVWLDR